MVQPVFNVPVFPDQPQKFFRPPCLLMGRKARQVVMILGFHGLARFGEVAPRDAHKHHLAQAGPPAAAPFTAVAVAPSLKVSPKLVGYEAGPSLVPLFSASLEASGGSCVRWAKTCPAIFWSVLWGDLSWSR